MPDRIERDLNMAIVATYVDSFQKKSIHGKRRLWKCAGTCIWNPCNEFQEGKYRAAVNSPPRVPPGRGASKGTRSFRTKGRTSVRDGTAQGN
jgi:hypothetical protein